MGDSALARVDFRQCKRRCGRKLVHSRRKVDRLIPVTTDRCRIAQSKVERVLPDGCGWLTIRSFSDDDLQRIPVHSFLGFENILRAAKLGLADDIGEVRADLLAKSRAEASLKEAEARQKVAAAVEAENRSRFAGNRAVDLIRFGGHLPKGGYDVPNGRDEEPTAASAVHG